MKLSKRLGAFWALNLSLLPSVLASSSCSQLSGSIYTGPNNNKFDILCDTSTVSGHISAYYSQGDEFQDCVDRCDGDSNCIVALYLDGSGDCALIDNYQGTRSFSGNDVAIKGAVESSTSASSEATSTEATTSEAPTSETATSSEAASTSEAATTEATSTEATSTEATSTEATSTEATSTEATSTEATTSEATTSEAATSDTLTILTTSETPSISSVSSSSISSEDTASGFSSTSEPLSASTVLSATLQPSSSDTTSETSTSPGSTTATADSFSTITSGIEISTDDCDDETSSIGTLATVTTSTAIGSEIQSTALSTDSQSTSIITIETSELSTSSSSTISSASSLTTTDSQASLSTSLPSSVTSKADSSLAASSRTTVTHTYTTYSQVASSSASSSSETTEVGSKTLSASGATIIKTTSDSHLPTSYPTTDSVWTVYLTLVKYVTCTTGVVAETVTTATYVTVDSNGGSYGPPVITTPAGCIGGYQVDASGHSYPVAQSTLGSPGNSQSSYETGHLHIPTPAAESHGNSQPEQGNKQPSVPESTQGSQANYPDNKNSQPSVPGQGSPEPNNSEPQPTGDHTTQTVMPAYHTGTLVNPPLSSPIHQGQQGISTTFTTEASVTEKIRAPKSTHSLSSSEAGDAPSTPVSISGANRHQCMALTLVAGALLGLGMLL